MRSLTSYQLIRHLLSVMLFLIVALAGNSQPSIILQYSYLHSPTLDKILQTYNTSRPWQEDKLVPLTSGYGGKLGWNFRIQKTHEIHVLPEIGYSKFGASSTNYDKKFQVGFHDFNVQVALRMHPRSIYKPVQDAGALGTRFYMSIATGISSLLPYSKTNGERWKSDDKTPYREFSFTYHFTLSAGFHYFSIGRFVMTPELGITWYPTTELTGFAEVVNGHNTVGLSNNANNVFLLNAGIRITFVKSNKNWWDRPREGDKT